MPSVCWYMFNNQPCKGKKTKTKIAAAAALTLLTPSLTSLSADLGRGAFASQSQSSGIHTCAHGLMCTRTHTVSVMRTTSPSPFGFTSDVTKSLSDKNSHLPSIEYQLFKITQKTARMLQMGKAPDYVLEELLLLLLSRFSRV